MGPTKDATAPLLVIPQQKSTQQQQQPAELSPTITIALVYITHGLMNAALLSPWNPVRCAYWGAACSESEHWMLNWLSFGLFHVHILLACTAWTAVGNAILEQRLLFMVATLIVSSISTGIFMVEHLNKPMAALQAVIYVGLLLLTAYMTATANAGVIAAGTTQLTATELRNSSFDARRKLPLTTVATFLQFLLAAARVVDMTFGSGRHGYLGDSSSSHVFETMSKAAVSCMLWATLILGVSTVMATVHQQKALLAGQAVALFVSILLLAGEQGAAIVKSQRHAGLTGTFLALVLALIGAF